MIIPPNPIRTETVWVIEYIKAHESEYSVYTEYETKERAMDTFKIIRRYENKRLVRREIKEYLVEVDQ